MRINGIDPTREEWQAARERVRSARLNRSGAHGLAAAALGPCPPEPPAPFRSATRTLVWTSGSTGELHIPAQALTPDEAEAMAGALVEHARYARERTRTAPKTAPQPL